MIAALSCLVLASAAWGAGFWDKKDFKQWTAKEVQRMLENSPWSKKVLIPVGQPMQAFSGGGGGGGRRGGAAGPPGGGGGGRGGGGARGGGGGAGMQTSQPPLALIVRFHDTLPVKRAIIAHHLSQTETSDVSPEMEQFLGNKEPYYVVAVAQLPQAMNRLADMPPEALARTARLRRKGKDDMWPQKVDVRAESGTTLYYYFSRDEEITLDDKEVEFAMKFERPQMGQRGQGQAGRRQGQGQRSQAGGGQGQGGQRPGAQGGQRGAGQGGRGGAAMALFGKDIRKKFKLKDMVYEGQLAL